MHAAKNCGPAREYGTADFLHEPTENLTAAWRRVKLRSLKSSGLYRSTDATPRCAVEIAPIIAHVEYEPDTLRRGGCHAIS